MSHRYVSAQPNLYKMLALVAQAPGGACELKTFIKAFGRPAFKELTESNYLRAVDVDLDRIKLTVKGQNTYILEHSKLTKAWR